MSLNPWRQKKAPLHVRVWATRVGQACMSAGQCSLHTHVQLHFGGNVSACGIVPVTCDFQKLLMQCLIFGSICVECRLRGLTMRAAQLVHNLMKLQAPKANSVQTRLFSVQLERYLSKVATRMVAPPAQFDECFAICASSSQLFEDLCG